MTKAAAIRVLGVLLALCLALPGAGQAADPDAARVWQALSGDRLRLDGREYRLAGVTCPDPGTAAGRAAKALLNTFLRGGYVACRVAGGRAACAKAESDAAEGLIRSGHCAAAPASPLPEDAPLLVRDTRPGTAAQDARADGDCAPGARVDRFIAMSRALACDAGVPFSLCDGSSGQRRAGRHVARSDRYRAPGQATPSYRPFDCR